MTSDRTRRAALLGDNARQGASKRAGAFADHADSEQDVSHLPIVDFDDPALAEYLRAKVQEALDDPRLPMPLDEAFGRLEARLQADVKQRGFGT